MKQRFHFQVFLNFLVIVFVSTGLAFSVDSCKRKDDKPMDLHKSFGEDRMTLERLIEPYWFFQVPAAIN